MSRHVYLSPHLDDAVFSCGGLIARQVAAGDTVTVLTICAGDPPEGQLSDLARALHLTWGVDDSPVKSRREEDRAACARLGASPIHLDIPDAVYRSHPSSEPVYPSFDDVFGRLHPAESELLDELTRSLVDRVSTEDALYVPLGIGRHVDHQLARLAAENLDRSLRYYRDMPYAFREGLPPEDLPEPDGGGLVIPLSEGEIDAWSAAVLDYRSQISSFWAADEEVMVELSAYHASHGGIPLIESGA
jgi:LmbE family N-acetylglucosaminyl deacetylase